MPGFHKFYILCLIVFTKSKKVPRSRCKTLVFLVNFYKEANPRQNVLLKSVDSICAHC